MSDNTNEKNPTRKTLGLSARGGSKTVSVVRRRTPRVPGKPADATKVDVKQRRTFSGGGLRGASFNSEAFKASTGAGVAAKKEETEETVEVKVVETQKSLTDNERVARAYALLSAEEQKQRRDEEVKKEALRKEEEEKENKQREADEAAAAAKAASASESESADAPAAAEKKEKAVEEKEETVDVPVEAKDEDAAKRAQKFKEENDAFENRKHRKMKELKSAEATRDRRRSGKLTVTQALSSDGDGGGRKRSFSAMRRAQEKKRKQLFGDAGAAPTEKKRVVRTVTIPEAITVQELSNRMAEQGGEVIKTLMKMGVMATITQTLDSDIAQIVVEEFGHKVERVSESDVESIIHDEPDNPADLAPRSPVVTVMGHVDHGKTSLLDAIRKTDVASGEAGGITQDIGAYQVHTEKGGTITFIDTPGHEAFAEMRARGANVTDIVILVVAADDGVKPQTIEAIKHAKAAKVPIVVAINKIDKEGADPTRVKNELLQHEIIMEELGGDVMAIEVSAKEQINLEALEEALLLQAEVLDLKGNPKRMAQGTVIESKIEKGRGALATILVSRGTLRVGDIFVTGCEVGRVRAMHNERGQPLKEATPSVPVEVIGLNGVPEAGDDFIVVESDAKAREIAGFRSRQKRNAAMALKMPTGDILEQMMAAKENESRKELPIVIKAGVQGSIEAIAGSLSKVEALTEKEISIRILSSGTGGINESDVNLAKASGALIIGFNVRANPQARELARREGVEIRYYSIIYNIVDDIKSIMSGMLAPTIREEFIGNAEIRQVFNMSKFGKVAGCMITEGMVKRGAKVRLLRESVVIHEGTLSTLKRFKDEVKEAKEGYECGMAFEKYEDIQEGDIIECFDVTEEARTL
ncbi:MAG: translation initiation factor IF-2 [Alphaproteobacteria bacterium]